MVAEALTVTIPEDDAFAQRMGVSLGAVQLLRDSEVLDAHLDCFIPPRLYGYDLTKRHKKAILGGRFFGHLDFHRALEAGLTGGMWSITTNPFRFAGSRWRRFGKNLERFEGLVAQTGGRYRLVKSHSELEAARADGAHAIMLAIQGGNCCEKAPEGALSLPDSITRVTVVHLTNSCYGATSSPLALWRRKQGLSDKGREFVRQLNEKRIFVDLAHINREGFWDAVEVHDKAQPLISTHTGVCGVREHWRNLDDRQVKAIADTGGVVGIIFSMQFLKTRGGPRDADMIVDHIAHTIDVGGEASVCLGSDYDGAITPPPDMRTGVEYVRLVQKMLDRGWSEDRIRRVLGLNLLGAFRALRP